MLSAWSGCQRRSEDKHEAVERFRLDAKGEGRKETWDETKLSSTYAKGEWEERLPIVLKKNRRTKNELSVS